jgi:RNA-directed DNA polymerase
VALAHLGWLLLYPLLQRINTYLVRWLRKKTQTAAAHEEGQRGLATHHQPGPRALRPLGMDARILVVAMTRAR